MYDSPSLKKKKKESPLHPGGLVTPSVGEPGNCTMGKGEEGEDLQQGDDGQRSRQDDYRQH